MTLSSTARQIVFWVLIIAGAILLYNLVNPRGAKTEAIDLTTLTKRIDEGGIKQLTLEQNEAIAIDVSNQELRAQVTSDQIRNEIFKKANEKNQDGNPKVLKFEDKSGSSSYFSDAYHLGAAAVHYRHLGFHAAADAVRWKQSALIW